ncbi:YcjX family protein, partial [Rhizobium ruizarguesonis]
EGETIAGKRFDGQRKTAIFPGYLPEDPESLGDRSASGETGVQLPDVNVVRFRPPHLEETGGGIKLAVPHIRLDRAMQ